MSWKYRIIDMIDPQARVQKKEINTAVIKMVESIKQQHYMYRKEIQEWRMARYIAKAPIDPRRKRIIDLYEEIMSDAFIFGRWQTRMLRVSNKELAVKTDGATNDEKTKLLQKGWARQLTKYNMESIAYGYTLPYVKDLTEEGLIKSVDMIFRDHVVPETKEVLKSPEDKNGYRFDKAPYDRWMYFVNNTHNLGLLDKAAPLYIFKKHSWQNWDEFEEKFGIPMRIAKVASQDKAVLAEIDKWLKDLGSAAYARFPEGTELDIKETSTTDAFNVFNEKRKACNEELATLFDGHFETAKDSGSRAKAGSIIESTQDMITQDDEAFNLDVWNDVILPWLIQMGYPFNEGDMVVYNENIVSTPKERLEIFMGVKDLGYKVSKKQIETELDVEIEEEQTPPAPPPEEGKKSSNQLANFELPHNHGNGCGAHLEDYRIINADVVGDLTPDEEKLLKAIYSGDVNWDYNEFKASHGPLLDALRKGTGKMDIDYDGDTHKMSAMMRANIHRFGMDKTTAEIFQLNEIIKDPAVDSYPKFRERALKVFPNYKEHWLHTEHQQAFVTGQMGARYQEMIGDIEDAPYWRLSAILDNRTTTICRSLDGKVFKKSDADAWKFLPPNHFNCRSDAEDVLDSYGGEVSSFGDAVADDPDGWERQQKSGHDVNWGDKGQVFSAGQSYLKKVSAKALTPNELTYKDYGLGDSLKSVLKTPKKAFKWGGKLDANGNIRILDNELRPRWVSGELLARTDKDLTNTLPELMTVPDEVYYYQEGTDEVYRYLKKYKEFTSSAVVRFARDKSAIIEVIAKADNSVRRGLLVHNRPDAVAVAKGQYEDYGKEWKKVTFNEDNGGYVVYNKLHGRAERAQNVATGKLLADKGYRIELLEDIKGVRSADAKISDVEWELKYISKAKKLDTSIMNHLERGVGQSNNIMIHIDMPFSYDQIHIGLNRWMGKAGISKFENYAILVGDKLFFFGKQDLINGSFRNIIK